MPLLLSACPSFGDPWRRYVSDSRDVDEWLYVHLGEFARHLVNLERTRATSEFDAVFEAIETLHTDGDAYVREAATIGLLEGIQNIAEHAGVHPESFVPYLRPESAKWWAKLNAFWDGDIRALRE